MFRETSLFLYKKSNLYNYYDKYTFMVVISDTDIVILSAKTYIISCNIS